MNLWSKAGHRSFRRVPRAFEPGRELHVRIEVISRVCGSCASASAVLVSEGGEGTGSCSDSRLRRRDRL